ncbi:tRNA1(Val) (adenine(37)-N6)-methyltransferase [Desulfatibacillum aliphaticivorans]|uniref:tRNA1(Val) (adenine(37)-N6)-methyltransferase n=1 Tax=Desulfatibacillum aliphaticivorans TaxID=218208 RepID=UPI00040192BC|nr:methyltransferase [Desulfatibacillum aliphaticivorans]
MVDENAPGRDNLTNDSILGGKIRIFQEKNGYRFSLDAVLLPHFVQCGKDSLIVDLGTGAGVIPLILTSLYPDIKVYGVEIQDSLAGLAERNVRENGLQDRISVIRHDLKKSPIQGLSKNIDYVVSNPPYRRLGSGRINPDSQKAAARHEILANLEDTAGAAARLLGKGGRFAVVYPATRTAELIHCLTKNSLEPKRMRAVHSNTLSPARLVLVEAVKGAGPQITVERPLFIYRDDDADAYTDEVQAMLYPS